MRRRSQLELVAVAVAMIACASVACSSEPAAPAPTASAEPTEAGAVPVGDHDAAPANQQVPDAQLEAGVDAGPPLDVPASLVKALGAKTYVEESCTKTTYPGWPFDAQKCTYHSGLVVTIANPPADRVARWIVDASTLIPALDALHTRDRASWEAGLAVIAAHTIGQSSRIFPLEGQVWENGTAYKFERGVTKTCSSGCYCRINSTSRPQWCAYADKVLGIESEGTCLDKYGQTSKTLTDPWLAHCMENHVASWNADRNEHYRAQAWNANLALAAKFPSPQTAVGSAVVAALELEYP